MKLLFDIFILGLSVYLLDISTNIYQIIAVLFVYGLVNYVQGYLEGNKKKGIRKMECNPCTLTSHEGRCDGAIYSACGYCGSPDLNKCHKNETDQSILKAYFYGTLIETSIPYAEQLLLSGIEPEFDYQNEYPIQKILKYDKSCETCRKSKWCKFMKIQSKCGKYLDRWEISSRYSEELIKKII
ncbi:MAG: hypothetical protein PHC28_12280 [Flavobacterium sp.]|uniref:hypothetical protein n=1 Tax=Flavobacterium sp. TaxID=239 RepID=UPI00262E8109|nr:hypothetical protein [Flavobacterium sp.]MDD5151231.1 hypothetical protein [Flavobacterium sp.]